MGYMIIDGRAHGEGVREYDTIACGHFQAVIDKKRWALEGGIYKCSGCRKALCHQCTDPHKITGQCDPWQEKAERAIKQWEVMKRGGA